MKLKQKIGLALGGLGTLASVNAVDIEKDKLLHFGVSAGMYTGIEKTLLLTTDLREEVREGIAFYTTFAVGVGKEIYDSKTGGRFNSQDLLYDCVGNALMIPINRKLNEWLFGVDGVKVRDSKYRCEGQAYRDYIHSEAFKDYCQEQYHKK